MVWAKVWQWISSRPLIIDVTKYLYLISLSMMLNRSQQWDSQMVQTRSSQEVLITMSRCGTFVRMKWRWNCKGTQKQSPACSLAQMGLTFLQILWIALCGSGICALMHPRYIVHFQYLLPSEVFLLLCLTTRNIWYYLLVFGLSEMIGCNSQSYINFEIDIGLRLFGCS